MPAPPITPLLRLPATLVRRSAGAVRDEYGNVELDELELATTCELQQSGAREDLDGAVQVVTWRVFLPPDAPARGWDALRVDGRLLELEGDAWTVVNPRSGETHHVEAYLRETE
jgi:hypothetical protein